MGLDEYAGVIFVSQTAIRFALDQFEVFWPQWPSQQHWCAMGAGSAQLIRNAHHPVVVASPATSEGLLAQLALQQVAGERWLIVRGLGGRELLRDQLLARGARVDYLELYERKSRAHCREIQLLINSPLDGIFVSSTQALSELATAYEGRFNSAPALVVPGVRAALQALELGFNNVIEAASAADEDLFTAWSSAKG